MSKYKVCVYKTVTRADIHLEAENEEMAKARGIAECELGKHAFYGTDLPLIALAFAEELPSKTIKESSPLKLKDAEINDV